MGSTVREILRALASQDKAIANARASATVLSRGRVEREEVELYFEELEARAAAVWAAATDAPRGVAR